MHDTSYLGRRGVDVRMLKGTRGLVVFASRISVVGLVMRIRVFAWGATKCIQGPLHGLLVKGSRHRD